MRGVHFIPGRGFLTGLAILALALAGRPCRAQEGGGCALRVYVFDDLGRAVEGASVALEDGEEAGSPREECRTDPDGLCVLDVQADLQGAAVRATFGDLTREARRGQVCSSPELLVVLSADDDGPPFDQRDPAGRPLPPLPPVFDDPGLRVTAKDVRRYAEPGLFGVNFGLGLDVCAHGLGGGAACDRDRRLGFSATGSFLIYVAELWKISLAVGAFGGYRLNGSPLDDDGETYLNNMIATGPELFLVGASGDWVFGVRGVPFGYQRIESVRYGGDDDAGDEERISANTAFWCAAAFLGWRAWGHVPVGLYLELSDSLDPWDSGVEPARIFTAGVFAGRRFGAGRTLTNSFDE